MEQPERWRTQNSANPGLKNSVLQETTAKQPVLETWELENVRHFQLIY